jgi:membrane protein DedA with SNARE-associated domain
VRLAMSSGLLLAYGLKLHFHILHHVQGPTIDYAAVAAGAFASWAGVPGPGEPLLIAAGIFAAKHKLDISPVLFWAWAGAAGGGVVGWLIGALAGRSVVTAPGPLRSFRLSAVAKGDQVFKRFAVIAILLAPSWISGIHRVRAAIYLPTNAVAAALWAAGIGIGAYYIGPPIVEFVDDLGWVTASALGVLALGVVAAEVARRRRGRARAAGAAKQVPD